MRARRRRTPPRPRTSRRTTPGPNWITCTEASSLESFCCSNTELLGPACPRDFASFAAICGSNPNFHLFLDPTPCAGNVFATVSGTDTGTIFAFDEATGALRAILSYGGLLADGCQAAADPSVAVLMTCGGTAGPVDACRTGNEPVDGGFVSFCSTTSGGDPACPTTSAQRCAYPTSCVGGRCSYVPGDDAGADGG